MPVPAAGTASGSSPPAGQARCDAEARWASRRRHVLLTSEQPSEVRGFGCRRWIHMPATVLVVNHDHNLSSLLEQMLAGGPRLVLVGKGRTPIAAHAVAWEAMPDAV